MNLVTGPGKLAVNVTAHAHLKLRELSTDSSIEKGNPSTSNADTWSGRRIIVADASLIIIIIILVGVYSLLKHIFDRWGDSNRNDIENPNLETPDDSDSNSQQQVQIQMTSATTLSDDGIYANIQMASEIIDAPISIDSSQVQAIPDDISDDLEAPILIGVSQIQVVQNGFPIPSGDIPGGVLGGAV